MKTMRQFVAIAALLLCAVLVGSESRGSDCGPVLYRRITAALKDPAFKTKAGDWVRRYQKAEPTVHRGMLKAAIHKDVKALQEGFRDLPVGANPFSSEEEVYRVIGELTDDAYVGAPGLNGTLGNLFADTSPNEKGALLTLKVADDRGLASKIAPGNGAGFEQEVTRNGASRRYDMREPDTAAPPELQGVVHENKNWTTPLSGPDDFRLEYFADEFRRDILIHAGTNWNHYRINLRTAVQGQGDLIRGRLVQEFSRQEIIDRLGEDAVLQLRARFEQLWNAGASGGLLAFY